MSSPKINIDNHIKSYENKKIFVAVSGGIDSMVLLDVLAETNLNISALHVNYNLRGEESNEDVQFVIEYCTLKEIPIEVKNIDLKKQLETGGNLQELARDLRYAWFDEIVSSEPESLVAVAHHSDDQVETFFINLSRKSGIMGLAAMQRQNGKIIRPLLDFSSREIESHAKSEGIPWREDSSNKTNSYVRNKLRNVFIPFSEAIVPSIKEDILLLISQFKNLQREIEKEINPIAIEVKKSKSLSIRKYSALDDEHKIELFRQLDLSFTLLSELDKLVFSQKGKKIELNHGLFQEVVRDSSEFIFILKSPDKSQYSINLKIIDKLPNEFTKDFICLDDKKVHGELKVRRWQNGDRIKPIGVNGSKLISDIISDNKVASGDKSKVLVVHDENEIHWCVGLKIGRSALADTKTETILQCSIETTSIFQ